MPRENEFLTWVESTVGMDYAHCGRTEYGLDCIGIVCYALSKMGIPYEDMKQYPRQGYENNLVKYLSKQLDEVPISERKPSDILVFWIDRKTREPQHIGVCVLMKDGKEGMIHSYLDVRKVAKSHLDKRWKRRLCKVFRIPEEMWQH